MKSPVLVSFLPVITSLALFFNQQSMAAEISLPKPAYKGTVTVEEALRPAAPTAPLFHAD